MTPPPVAGRQILTLERPVGMDVDWIFWNRHEAGDFARSVIALQRA